MTGNIKNNERKNDGESLLPNKDKPGKYIFVQEKNKNKVERCVSTNNHQNVLLDDWLYSLFRQIF